jgi:hypothetical protein
MLESNETHLVPAIVDKFLSSAFPFHDIGE